MPIREEGMRLRVLSDVASLRAGKREIQEWSKEIELLSKRIREGLGTKEDLRNLKQYQGFAARAHKEYTNRVKEFQREQEGYEKRAGAGAGAAPRGMFGFGARPGAVTRGLGMARGIPIVGGMLGMGYLISKLHSALSLQQQLAISASQTAQAFTVMGGQSAIMAEALGKPLPGLGYMRAELIQAGAAMVTAGGGRMAGARDVVARFARARGADITTLAALTGGAARAGAFAPGEAGAERFLARMEISRRARGMAFDPQSLLSLQQYTQTVVPFLQAQGRFMPSTEKSEAALNRMFTTLMGRAGTIQEQKFVERNIGATAAALSGAIRQPRGAAAEFFTMRALGLGEPGVRYFDVIARQEQGLTEDNLERIHGRAMRVSKLGAGGRTTQQERYAVLMRSYAGLTIESGKALFGRLTPEGEISEAELKKVTKEIEEAKLPLEAKAALALKESMDTLNDEMGKILKDLVPALVDLTIAINKSIGFWVPGGGFSEMMSNWMLRFRQGRQESEASLEEQRGWTQEEALHYFRTGEKPVAGESLVDQQ